MTFFICLLCLVAGIAIGVGFTQVICTGMVNDTNKIWINALIAMDKMEKQVADDKVVVYENVTVFASDGDISWQKQSNTVEMSYEDWEKKQGENNT